MHWLVFLSLLSFHNPVQAANLDVCGTCTYTTIQAAVDAATSGDVIRVVGGSFSGANIQRPVTVTSLTLQGGYSSNFSVRDPDAYETIVTGFINNYFNRIDTVIIDGFTIDGAAYSGIESSGESTNLTIQNCTIRNSGHNGIGIYGAKDVIIDNNIIHSNVGGYGGIAVRTTIYNVSGSVSITNNLIYNHLDTIQSGIYFGTIKSSDLVTYNTVRNNRIGINLNGHGYTPEISHNTVFDNSSDGMFLNSGTYWIHHNLVHSNGGKGLNYYNPGSSVITNNTFANNTGYGLHVYANSGTPTIKNNIFYNNDSGLYISGSSNGAGSTSMTPTSMSHNVSFGNIYYDYIHSSLGPAYVYDSEVPGDWNDVNQFAWSEANMVMDPGFIDPENDNYNLSSGSFLIDEGDPSDSFSNEPSSNGSRINIGHQGNSSSAQTSSALPVASNIEIETSTDDFIINFDLSNTLLKTWISLSYWDGSAYQNIDPGSLSGSGYVEGYKTGRITTGNSKSLAWTGARTTVGSNLISNFHIKISLEHGTQAGTENSTAFDLYAPATPTPTPTPSPTATPTPTPEASPTPTPEPVDYGAEVSIVYSGPNKARVKINLIGESCGTDCYRFSSIAEESIAIFRFTPLNRSKIKKITGCDTLLRSKAKTSDTSMRCKVTLNPGETSQISVTTTKIRQKLISRFTN